MRLRRYIEHARLAPELVLCSSARRTVATLEGIRAALPRNVTVKIEDGLYAVSAERMLRRLRETVEEVTGVLLIAHNPGVEQLAHLLVGEGETTLRERLDAKFPTGALASLSFDGGWAGLGSGVATLEAFVVPRELE